jgi:hypothetical protein
MLAAAVDDPIVLERLRRRARSRGDTAVDFERVRLFAGLAAKVRQNDIRLRLPLTFALLDRLKVSIEIFADYAKPAAALRKANKKSPADKIDSFCEFLDGWLDHGNPDHALAWDLIRHERVLLELRDGATAAPVQPGDAKRRKVTAKSIPVRRARTVHHEMSANPLQLEQILRTRSGDLSALARGQFHYVYRWDELRGCVSIDAVDELGCVLFDCADGANSVAQMAAALRHAGVAVDAGSLCGAVQQLVDNGALMLRG